MTPAFVHLRVHSEYSLVNGVVRVNPLVHACAKAGMPAVAVTAQCTLFALEKFYKAALAAGLLPLVGVDFLLHFEAFHNSPTRLLLLCQYRSGNLNLTQHNSRCY